MSGDGSQMVVKELHDAWETILLLKSENEKLKEQLQDIRNILGPRSYYIAERGDSGKDR